jgi:hypothetical protein
MVTTSGRISSCWWAKKRPVRPIPDWISSTISSTPAWRVSSRTARRYPGGGTRIPASPWIGSTRTAAVSGPMAAARASTSPNGTWENPGGNGWNGVCMAGLPVAASVARVRPWKPPRVATIPVAPSPRLARPHRLATLMAASLASAPELDRKTLASPPKCPTSRSASSTWGPVKYRLEVCPRVPSWALTASTTRGWACPAATTAIPPRKSRYSRPRASHSRTPRPRTNSTGGRA